jgi:hypothetical protein
MILLRLKLIINQLKCKVLLNQQQNNYIKVLAKANSLDPRVCKAIVDSPFAYLKHLITSPTAEEGLRLMHLGAFSQKGNYKNKTMRTATRAKALLGEIEDVTIMMAATLGFIVPTVDSAKALIEEALEKGDNEKINMIWDGWLEYNK